MPSCTALELAAMELFASEGFAAASMRTIAAAAGIRAPSVYSHFESKEALFRHLLELAERIETEFIEAYFSGKENLSQAGLFRYFDAAAEHAQAETAARFYLSIKFLPPRAFREEIDSSAARTANLILKHAAAAARASGRCRLAPELFAQAYWAAIESLECDLVYYKTLDYWKDRRDALSSLLKLSFAPRCTSYES